VPPRRNGGRHRKPKQNSGPAYVTAATLAAFTVSGLNVPGAIGAAHGSGVGSSSTEQLQQARTIAAGQLRQTLVQQDTERASRLRAARTSMVRSVQDAAEAERKAREAARPKWVIPVDHFRLTAGFGDYGLWSSAHTGQDFAAPEGTPVHAVGDGKIIFAGWDGAYGNKIAIEHPDGTVTWYAHMSAFIRTDGTVEAGDVIGRVGSTGNTTGPHLHLEVRPHNGDPIPPLTWLRQHGIKV
jgi:murein DD-endopeptidase MepM/ murein hydrolase activator NlpD